MNADEFLKAAYRAGRNAAPGLLWDAAASGDLPRGEVAAVVATAWCMAEWPERALSPRAAWLALFQAAGFTIDGKPAERPAGPLTLYRGCTRGRVRGLAWTTDREMAGWFARRYGDFAGDPSYPEFRPAFVYTTVAPSAALLCIPGTAGRFSEHEVVINPAGLKIQRVAP
jgi:hypothetical protein